MAEGRVSLGNPLPFARGAVAEGLSARASLAIVRDTGWAISNERWFSAFRTATQSADIGVGIDRFPNDLPVPFEAHTSWAAGTPGTYLYNGDAHVFDPATGITARINQSVKSDVPLTPDEVGQAIYDEWADPDNAASYDLQIIGATLTGAYYMTGAIPG